MFSISKTVSKRQNKKGENASYAEEIWQRRGLKRSRKPTYMNVAKNSIQPNAILDSGKFM